MVDLLISHYADQISFIIHSIKTTGLFVRIKVNIFEYSKLQFFDFLAERIYRYCAACVASLQDFHKNTPPHMCSAILKIITLKFQEYKRNY